MKTVSDQIDLELMSYFPNETSAEVSGRGISVEEFDSRVNQDEVLSRALQHMKALVESRNLHLQVLAACTSPNSPFSVDGGLSFSPAAPQREKQPHV